MASTVVVSEMEQAERARFLDFLVAHRVEFAADKAGQRFTAKVRVTCPSASDKQASCERGPPADPKALPIPQRRSRSEVVAGGSEAATPTLDGSFSLTSVSALVALGSPASMTSASPSNKSSFASPGAGGSPLQPWDAHTASVLASKYFRFLREVPAPEERPKPWTWPELSRFVEDVFEFRCAQDADKLKNEAFSPVRSDGEARVMDAIPENFPKTVMNYSKNRKGLPKLVNVFCWGLAKSVDNLRHEILGAEMFGRFLEESYDVKDLLFYLRARSSVKRAMRLDPRSGWMPTGDGSPSKVLQVPPSGKAMPRRIDARLAIQIVRDCVASRPLQDRIFLERLDPWMHAQQTASIDIDLFLQMLTEEHHNYRADFAVPGEVLDHVQEAKVLEFIGWVRFALEGDLQTIFDELDMHESGIVTRSQFVTVVSRMGYKGDVAKIWDVVDRHGTGHIGRTEFLALGGGPSAEADSTPDEDPDGDDADDDGDDDAKLAPTSESKHCAGSKRSQPDNEQGFNLDPEVQREADLIAQRLEASMQANKVPLIRKQEIYTWAAQIAMKRHSVRPRALQGPRDSVRTQCTQEDQQGYAVSMEVMEKTWSDMYSTGSSRPSKSSFSPAPRAAALKERPTSRSPGGISNVSESSSTADFAVLSNAGDLLELVHSAMYQATRYLAGDAARAAIASTGLDAQESDLADRLVKRLTPIADAMLETLVNDDYAEWVRLLQIKQTGESPGAAARRRRHFDHTRKIYLSVLSNKLTKDVLLRICDLVLSADEMTALARRFAGACLTKLAQPVAARNKQPDARAVARGSSEGYSRAQRRASHDAGDNVDEEDASGDFGKGHYRHGAGHAADEMYGDRGRGSRGRGAGDAAVDSEKINTMSTTGGTPSHVSLR